MKVIIPLAGFGTRLRPHTYTKPKPMINVAGKPVLGHLLDKLAGLDVEEYIFIVGYLGDQVEDYVNSEYKLNARFIEQKELLGQAHAINLAKDFLKDEPILIVFVDTLFEADLSILKSPDTDAVVFVKEVEDPRRFGVVTLRPDQTISGFVEKSSSMINRLAIVGLYYFNHANVLLDAIQELMQDPSKMLKNEYFLADAMQIMVNKGSKFRPGTVSVWLDCGQPETVLETNRHLLANGHDNSEDFKDRRDVIIRPPVNIHPTATIEHSVIGPNVTIAANCTIINTNIRNSIIDEGATCNDVFLASSLVGRKALVSGHHRMINVGDSSAVEF